ncbi:MAG: hypothetical protein JWL86_3541 [Rhizobium sp.]|nr:hypothetical protein [Rhizobium sp.]
MMRESGTERALRAMVSAFTPTVEAIQSTMNHLSELPEAAREGYPYREMVIEHVRQGIAWKTVCARSFIKDCPAQSR